MQEFQINSNAYAAEYGRAAGGVINVVTRSGSNTPQGSLFEFYRDQALNATSAINRQDGLPKSPYHYHQFGGTLGGPVRASRDFFFFNYDGHATRNLTTSCSRCETTRPPTRQLARASRRFVGWHAAGPAGSIRMSS
ncbi:MAG TPA: hypothetical protein VMO26_12645 [Vicinamibacterales bacterium]|nr:hypothetical protein [Vicinamibacterales bacterium]